MFKCHICYQKIAEGEGIIRAQPCVFSYIPQARMHMSVSADEPSYFHAACIEKNAAFNEDYFGASLGYTAPEDANECSVCNADFTAEESTIIYTEGTFQNGAFVEDTPQRGPGRHDDRLTESHVCESCNCSLTMSADEMEEYQLEVLNALAAQEEDDEE